MKNKILLIMLLFVLFFSCKLFNPDNSGKGTVTDYDGNIYRTVKIGNQWWMAENLKVRHFNNGDAIPYINEDTWYDYNGRYDEESQSYMNNSAYCYYNDDSTYALIYGALYNAYVMMDNRELAPEGWHIPSNEEWNELQISLGMTGGQIDSFENNLSLDYGWNDIGFKLKAESGWEDYVDSDPAYGGNGIDDVGFCALPAGWRWNYGDCFDVGKNATFWTSTKCSEMRYWYRALASGGNGIIRDSNFISFGFSIRCVKDDD